MDPGHLELDVVWDGGPGILYQRAEVLVHEEGVAGFQCVLVCGKSL
jgi:hypothetical protein